MSNVDGAGMDLKTDVLVIGGGPAAAWAAIAARERGAEVVIVDKGYIGSSGAFAASTSGHKVLPPVAELRDPIKFERYTMGGFLAQHRWWDRLLDITYDRAPRIWSWATARWSYFAGLQRTETRGMHKRLDYPALDPAQRHYLRVGGLDKLWTRADPVPEAIVEKPIEPEIAVAAE